MITIVDYGMGNLGSIQNMFKRIGIDSQITGDLDAIDSATKILLPGVGAFDSAMQRMNESGMRDVLHRKCIVQKTPILGICLGMQLLTNGSEEGSIAGLGWIDAFAFKFPCIAGLKVPHMGWNDVHSKNHSPLTIGVGIESRFYFVHSYYVRAKRDADVILQSHYGVTFDAAIGCENIYGAQFHPEKSHKFGMRVLANFARV